MQACAERYRLPGKRLSEDTLHWFERYRWPGNVRELENLIHREYLLSDQPEVCIKVLGSAASCAVSESARGSDSAQMSYQAAKSLALENFDRAYLTQLLQRTQGNVTRAAQLAGKERRALGKLLKRYQIERDPPA
jgi:DNA-binding NtrC family response regulator